MYSLYKFSKSDASSPKSTPRDQGISRATTTLGFPTDAPSPKSKSRERVGVSRATAKLGVPVTSVYVPKELYAPPQPQLLAPAESVYVPSSKEVGTPAAVVGGKNKAKYEKYKNKNVLGKNRVIFRKKNSKSKKEYIKNKGRYISLKKYIKLKKS